MIHEMAAIKKQTKRGMMIFHQKGIPPPTEISTILKLIKQVIHIVKMETISV
ncbi:hypothetical protein D3C86_2211360 [compost metagenome]